MARNYFVWIGAVASLPGQVHERRFRGVVRMFVKLAEERRARTFEDFVASYEGKAMGPQSLFTELGPLEMAGIIELSSDDWRTCSIRVPEEYREAMIAAFGDVEPDYPDDGQE